MINLYSEISRVDVRQGASIIKHLSCAGISNWSDLTRSALMDLRDHLRETLSPSSGRTIAASLSAILHRYDGEGLVPCRDYADVLRLRGERCVRAYLTPDEIVQLAEVECHKATEHFVLDAFIVGCKTGARLSDLRCLTAANIQDGLLTYTSIKTGITASVPCSAATAERIARLAACRLSVPTDTYNETIRRLCRRAGIATPVVVHHGGRDSQGPKWQFVSSHTARVSLCTNLARAGVPMPTIAQIAGHTNIETTYRYVVRTAPVLGAAALSVLD